MNQFSYTELVLRRIRDFILDDLSTEGLLTTTKNTLESLAQVWSRHQDLFNPRLCLLPILRQQLSEIAFYVLNYKHSPVRYNLKTFQQVRNWYLCDDCLDQLAVFIFEQGIEINAALSVDPTYWSCLFCSSHWKMANRQNSWETLQIHLQRLIHDPTKIQIEIIICLNFSQEEKWC